MPDSVRDVVRGTVGDGRIPMVGSVSRVSHIGRNGLPTLPAFLIQVVSVLGVEKRTYQGRVQGQAQPPKGCSATRPLHANVADKTAKSREQVRCEPSVAASHARA